jgi:hypothetical protein
MKLIVLALSGVVLVTTAYGRGTPASPTPAAIAISSQAPATDATLGTTTWNCFTSDRAGIFAAEGCPSRIVAGSTVTLT